MFIGFANKYQRFIGVFHIIFKDKPTTDDLQRMIEVIKNEFDAYYTQHKKIFYQTVESLKLIFGESALVSLDLNLLYYGIEYTQSILEEWNECEYERKLAICLSGDSFVFPKEEGSLSILESLM